ncbi:hypothetical protein CYR75_15770 (plasmid) [Paracoccus jeotgali]|uniref:Uncharacterized protein n=1 Tax=Paracoccus jeotgali TaxID=2065379 RepID=A0A2K9MLB0_9RHOB|nr:hypothetical protein CYR75_15770 [Paracoccus jeotgali]
MADECRSIEDLHDLVLIGQKLAQDMVERELALGRDEGGGMGETFEDLRGLPTGTEGAAGEAAVW